MFYDHIISEKVDKTPKKQILNSKFLKISLLEHKYL